MIERVSINEIELKFIERFRVALSAPTHTERLTAIRGAKYEVIAGRLHEFSRNPGVEWVKHEDNRELADWAAAFAGEKEDAVYEFQRVYEAYGQKNERRLNIAEQIGKMIYLSIVDGKFEGVQTETGILYQVSVQGRELGAPGARDKDTLRKIWNEYRGVVHLGAAMDICEEESLSSDDIIRYSECIRKALSIACPRGTKKPYVNPDEQISFVYESRIWGPRFLNQGLPFYVDI